VKNCNTGYTVEYLLNEKVLSKDFGSEKEALIFEAKLIDRILAGENISLLGITPYITL